MRPITAVLIAGLALAGCERADEQPKIVATGDAMPTIPLPPNAELVSRSGSADALQLVLQSPASLEQVSRYYRGVFSGAGWNLVSDTEDRDSTITLYAEQAGHPMWVRLHPAGTATRVELMGAVPGAESAYARAAKAAHDTSNTMRPVR
jgi:hypothetical protein